MRRLLLSLICFFALSLTARAQLNCSGGALGCPQPAISTGLGTTAPVQFGHIGVGNAPDANSMIDVSGYIRSLSAGVAATTGVGAEMVWSGTAAIFQAYNRATSAYQPAQLAGSTVTISSTSGNTNIQSNGSNAIVASTGNIQFPAYVGGTLQSDGSGNLTSVLAPLITTLKDGNGNPFVVSSATTSAVDSITVTNAATANPATVTIAASGTDTNVNTALNAKGSGMVTHSTYMQATSNRVALTADWTCGNSGTVSSCVAAAIIGSGGGVPLTFTLPLQSQPWHWQCDGVVGQATAATANSWNFLTATNGATNVTASYSMNTAATAMTGGATTDQASTTSTVVIGPTWTLGGTATKMPFHIAGTVEGAAAAGTVLSLQLVAPTTADVVTIYRGASCTVGL